MSQKVLLDLFCGRWGWSKAFAVRGWECVGVDISTPLEIPEGCRFIQSDVLEVSAWTPYVLKANFIVASSPCEAFSKHGMKCFWPNPPYPAMGIKLFNHTRQICEDSGIPYVMENVRSAQKFVGRAQHHCGPFYLWGNSVPALLHQGIFKGKQLGNGGYRSQVGGKNHKEAASIVATIPKELANTVAEYAERILDEKYRTAISR